MGEIPDATPSRGETPPRLLIINADDFGLTPGVCRGILDAHERGPVRSTSALAIAPAYAAHAAALRDSGLGVGGHLAAVGEDPPLLTAREIPSLVDGSGRFPLTWQQFVRRAVVGAIDADDLRREFTAQVERLTGDGLVLTHLDSHQNLHLWPQVATVLFEIAARRRIGAIRLPRGSRWTATAVGVRSLSAVLSRRAAQEGIAVPEASTGLDEVPPRNVPMFLAAIERLARSGASTAELVTHLGQDPDPDRSRYATRFRWAEELEVLCDRRCSEAIERAGFRIGSFADLTSTAAPGPRTTNRPAPT